MIGGVATAEREPATDAQLLSAVAHGDRHAFAVLHWRYAAVLLGLLARILGSREEAEDILQEVFVQVWMKAGEFDASKGRVRAWLVTLARNRGLDRLSVLRSRHEIAASGTHYVPAEEPPDPYALTSLAEEARAIRGALAQIPPAQRDVLMLAYFRGLSQSEIATCLAAPLGTVKSHARLGLEKLRFLLGSNGAKGGAHQ
jgi:RNA polymerase sigma-70 factor (ECF subfamily)